MTRLQQQQTQQQQDGGSSEQPPPTQQNVPKATSEQLRIARITQDPSAATPDSDLAVKIRKVCEATRCSENDAQIALHDCDNNIDEAVNRIFDGSVTGDWQEKRGKKAKKAAAESQPELNHIDGDISGGGRDGGEHTQNNRAGGGGGRRAGGGRAGFRNTAGDDRDVRAPRFNRGGPPRDGDASRDRPPRGGFAAGERGGFAAGERGGRRGQFRGRNSTGSGSGGRGDRVDTFKDSNTWDNSMANTVSSPKEKSNDNMWDNSMAGHVMDNGGGGGGGGFRGGAPSRGGGGGRRGAAGRYAPEAQNNKQWSNDDDSWTNDEGRGWQEVRSSGIKTMVFESSTLPKSEVAPAAGGDGGFDITSLTGRSPTDSSKIPPTDLLNSAVVSTAPVSTSYANNVMGGGYSTMGDTSATVPSSISAPAVVSAGGMTVTNTKLSGFNPSVSAADSSAWTATQQLKSELGIGQNAVNHRHQPTAVNRTSGAARDALLMGGSSVEFADGGGVTSGTSMDIQFGWDSNTATTAIDYSSTMPSALDNNVADQNSLYSGQQRSPAKSEALPNGFATMSLAKDPPKAVPPSYVSAPLQVLGVASQAEQINSTPSKYGQGAMPYDSPSMLDASMGGRSDLGGMSMGMHNVSSAGLSSNNYAIGGGGMTGGGPMSAYNSRSTTVASSRPPVQQPTHNMYNSGYSPMMPGYPFLYPAAPTTGRPEDSQMIYNQLYNPDSLINFHFNSMAQAANVSSTAPPLPANSRVDTMSNTYDNSKMMRADQFGGGGGAASGGVTTSTGGGQASALGPPPGFSGPPQNTNMMLSMLAANNTMAAAMNYGMPLFSTMPPNGQSGLSQQFAKHGAPAALSQQLYTGTNAFEELANSQNQQQQAHMQDFGKAFGGMPPTGAPPTNATSGPPPSMKQQVLGGGNAPPNTAFNLTADGKAFAAGGMNKFGGGQQHTPPPGQQQQQAQQPPTIGAGLAPFGHPFGNAPPFVAAPGQYAAMPQLSPALQMPHVGNVQGNPGQSAGKNMAPNQSMNQKYSTYQWS